MPPDAGRAEGARPHDVLAAARSRAPATTASPSTTTRRPCTPCGRPSRRAASRWPTTSARHRWPRRAGTTGSWSGWCTTWRRSARCSVATCSAASSTATRACRSAGSRVASTGSRPPSRTPSTSMRRSSTWPTTRSTTTSSTTGAHHMYASFMVDPLGLEMIDRIGVDRVMWSSDYPAQREHVRLLGTVAGQRGRSGRPRGRGQDRQHERDELPRPRALMTRPAHLGAGRARPAGAARSGADAPRPWRPAASS